MMSARKGFILGPFCLDVISSNVLAYKIFIFMKWLLEITGIATYVLIES